MKIEKHNAHGMQLLASLSPIEVWQLIKKLAQTNNMVAQADVSHYVTSAKLKTFGLDVWQNG